MFYLLEGIWKRNAALDNHNITSSQTFQHPDGTNAWVFLTDGFLPKIDALKCFFTLQSGGWLKIDLNEDYQISFLRFFTTFDKSCEYTFSMYLNVIS
jgi:hypothetical protein